MHGLPRRARGAGCAAPRHPAPASLHARVRAEMARHGGGAAATAAAAAPLRPAPSRRRWFLAGAMAGALLAVGIGALTELVLSQRASDDVTIEAVDSHVRAT